MKALFLALAAALLAGLAGLPSPEAEATPPAPEAESHEDTDPASDAPRDPPLTATIDLAQLLEGVRQGSAVLQLAALSVPLETIPIDMKAPGWRSVLVDGETGERVVSTEGDLGTYRARLAGEPEFANPLTIVSGYVNAILALDPCTDLVVETDEGPQGDDRAHRVTYFLETCEGPADGDAASTDDPCPLPAISQIDGALAIEESPTCDPLVLAGLPLTNTGVSAIANGWTRPGTTINIDVGLGSDTQFYLAGTTTVNARQAAVLNNADSLVYGPTVNLNLVIATQWSWTAGGPTSTDCTTARNAFRTEWQTDPTLSAVSRDTTLALYQRDLSGSTVGCAHVPGVHDPTNLGYALTMTANRDSTEEYKTTAHEIGHNLYGEHGAGEKWWDWGCFCTKGTIMATKMQTKNKVNKFTEGDNDDFNAWRIRDCAEHMSSCSTRMKNIPEP